MSAYRHYTLCFLVAVVLYVALSIGTWLQLQREIFPFASWELFSYVPNELHDYGVRIIQVDGATVEGWPYLETLDALIGADYTINVHQAIQTLGIQVEQADYDAVEESQAFFEATHLGALGSVEYALYSRRSQPIARWRGEGFTHEVELAIFHRKSTQP
jgi:hypothetical protein